MIGNTSSVFKIHLPFLFPFFHQVRIRITSISINKITITTYLIFVIFLHMQNFWRIKFTPKYTVNYCVLLCITQQIHSKLPIFRDKSVKIYTIYAIFFYTGTACGACDKYELCITITKMISITIFGPKSGHCLLVDSKAVF